MDCPLSNDGLDERGVPDAATLGAKVLKDNLGLALVELDIENVQKLVELVSVYGAVLVLVKLVEHPRESQCAPGALLKLGSNHSHNVRQFLTSRERGLSVTWGHHRLALDELRGAILPQSPKHAAIRAKRT